MCHIRVWVPARASTCGNSPKEAANQREGCRERCGNTPKEAHTSEGGLQGERRAHEATGGWAGALRSSGRERGLQEGTAGPVDSSC
eukprot:2379471-Prymnesium_polylepis.1